MSVVLTQSIEGSCYFGGDAFMCAIQQLSAAFGGPALFGTILGGVIFIAFYIASGGSIATPSVALIITGTVIVPLLPGMYSQIAYGIALIGLAGAVWQVIQKYVLSTPVQ